MRVLTNDSYPAMNRWAIFSSRFADRGSPNRAAAFVLSVTENVEIWPSFSFIGTKVAKKNAGLVMR
jgi:hypothetical protein